MIHIATVHWESDKWIDIQLKYLNRYVRKPFRIYAFLSGSAANHRDKFYFASTEPIQSHAVKLNVLADIVCHEAVSDEDTLIFIDGDAFPIANTDIKFEEWLSTSPLAAIQRIENAGDIQPHPSFCITTVGFWRKIEGDWKMGFQWEYIPGLYRTDVGGNLLKLLNEGSVSWRKLLRTGGFIDHPILCSVYEGVIYHHAAGFRRPLSMYDRMNIPIVISNWKILTWLFVRLNGTFSLKNKFRLQRILRIDKKLIANNTTKSELFFEKMISDDNAFENMFKADT